MEKKFEDDELDKLLEEQFMKEADMIEEALFSDENFEDFEETDEEVRAAYDKLVARLKADGIYREDDDGKAEKESSSASGSVQTAAEIGDRAETISAQSTGPQEREGKVIPMRGAEERGEEPKGKKKKVFATVGKFVAAVAICVIITTIPSEATRSYIIKKINYFNGNDTRIVVGNNEQSDMLELNETEATNKVKDELGVKIPNFTYRPDTFEFYSYEVDSSAGFALLEYKYKDSAISMYINRKDLTGKNNMFTLHGRQIDTVNLQEDSISIKVLEVQDEQDIEPSFVAVWSIQEVLYQISGKMEKDEFINLIEKIRY